jgi:cob(I)alamin adenosyltransferase
MKIYTKVGDDGTTGHFGAPRVRKDDLRVAAYGDVDELNATLGVARCEVGTDAELEALLARLQSELFTLGAQLATPKTENAPKNVPAIREEDIARMETEIDRFDLELEPLRAFVLPAGTRLAASLHVCRTVCRRTERSVVTLDEREPVPALAVMYLNRLSDLLFTLARVANHRGHVVEAKWEPNRPA